MGYSAVTLPRDVQSGYTRGVAAFEDAVIVPRGSPAAGILYAWALFLSFFCGTRLPRPISRPNPLAPFSALSPPQVLAFLNSGSPDAVGPVPLPNLI